MKKSVSTFTLLVILFSNINAQVTVNGATLPARLFQTKTELVLNGAGVRTKYFIKPYVSGLYLKSKSSDAKEIINADKPMAVRMHIISNLMTNSNMTTAIIEGFEKSTNGNTKPIQPKIDICTKVFNKEPIKVGDVFDIYYIPNQGTKIFKNGIFQEPIIPGLDLKKAIFGIWLCDNPVEESLKKKMLGL